MAVEARFKLIEVGRKQWWSGGVKEVTQIKMVPVQEGPFWDATPQGTLDVLVVNPDAAAVFKDAPLGQEFKMLITPVEEQ